MAMHQKHRNTLPAAVQHVLHISDSTGGSKMLTTMFRDSGSTQP